MYIPLKIKGKILTTLVGGAILSFVAIGALTVVSLKGLAEYVLEKSTFLGDTAVADSKRALRKQSEEELKALAKDQAFITDLQLQRIAFEVKTIARVFGDILQEPNRGTGNPILAPKEKPDDVHAFSAFSLAPGVKREDVMGDLSALSQMDHVFKFIHANDPHLRLVYIGTNSGIIMKYPWTLTPQGYDPRLRGWFKRSLDCGRICWTGPYKAASYDELVLTCSQPVCNGKGKYQAVVAIDVSVDSIIKNFISTQIERNGSAFLLDSKGDIIAKEGLSSQGIRWDEDFKTTNLLKLEGPNGGRLKELAEKMIKGESGLKEITLNKETQFVAYAPVRSTNWSIGIIMPEKAIIESAEKTEKSISEETSQTNDYIGDYIKKRQVIFAGLSGFLLVVLISVGVLLGRRLTQPIIELGRGAQRIGQGDLNHHLNIKTGDEIEDLAETINKMTSDLKLYIRDLSETVAAKERIEHDLEVAHDIQASMLPRTFPPFPERKDLDVFASMEPAKQVGGDFYDFFFIDEDHLFFCIGDVSGKGVPAALFMAVTKTMLRDEALRGHSPSEILANVNNALEPENATCMFATVFCGILDTRSGDLLCGNAGHNPPLIYQPDGSFAYLDVEKNFVVGPMPAAPGAYKQQEFKLRQDGVIFLYSDGVTEAMNVRKELYSEEQLVDELNEVKDVNVSSTIERIRVSVKAHAGEEPQSDDITMLAVQYHGAGGQ